MNRFIIGGILAAIVVALTGGLGRMFTESDSQTRVTSVDRNNNNADDLGEAGGLGSLPVEQAGQLVRRQSDVGTGGTRTNPDFGGQGTQGMPPGGRPDISPNTTGAAGAVGTAGNVIPRTNQTTTFSTTGGDIAPIQRELVQPGVDQQRPIDPNVDSIPALW